AEQARDHVEGRTQIEIEHVRAMKRDSRIALACDGKEVLLQIQTYRFVLMRAERVDVLSGAACHVEQSLARRALVLSDNRMELRSFGGIILEAVDRVVECGRLGVHRRERLLLQLDFE